MLPILIVTCVNFREFFDWWEVPTWNLSGDIDAVDFEVNKPILLHGLILYGGIGVPYTYKIEVKVLSGTLIILHIAEQSVSESTQTFQIAFDKPCDITPNERYTLCAKIVGPDSYRGSYSACVKYEDYVFKFYLNTSSKNGTTEQVGQIPGLLFCPKG